MPDDLPMTGPVSLGGVLDRAFRLYRARLGPMLLVAAIFFVPLGLVNGWLTGSVMTGYLQLLQQLATNPGSAPPEETLRALGSAAPGLGALLLLALATFLVNGLTTLVLVAYCLAVVHGRLMGLRQAVRSGLGRFPAYLGMVLTQGCLGLFALSLFVIPGMAMVFMLMLPLGLVYGGGGDSAGAGMAILEALLFLAALLLVYAFMLSPLLYLAARWVAAMPSLVEQHGPWAALRRSWRLTSGQVWRSLAYVVLLGIMGQVIVFVIGLMLQIPLLLVVPQSVAGVVSGVTASIGRVLWQPVYAAALVMYYLDLRARQESPDLAQRIGALEAEVAGQPESADKPGEAGWSGSGDD